jgi:hypothetical protein
MPTLEIYRSDEGPDLDLTRILVAIEPFASSLSWYLIEFDPVMFVGGDGLRETPHPEWVLSLWHKIRSGRDTTRVEWRQLMDFARHVGQTDMALLIGIEPSEIPPHEPIDLNSPDFAVVIQALDGNIWAVTTRNVGLIEAFKAQFTTAREVEKAQRYY